MEKQHQQEPLVFIDLDTYEENLPPAPPDLFMATVAVKAESAEKPEPIAGNTREDSRVRVSGELDLDLTKYREERDPSADTSMALIVVRPPAEALGNSNNELTTVRPDNAMIRNVPDNAMIRNVTTIPGDSGLVFERIKQGNGHADRRIAAWDGPPRWATSQVGILTVQCARCLKWRVVPTREQYEAIREHILEKPWVCENALEWRPDAHCDYPTDLSQDSQMLWVIDKPNLPSSPPGWQRKVVVRSDCSTKFADVYYTAPDGKSLRSMVEISKYLDDNPGSVPQGTHLNQFSFTIPQPLPGVWAPKKSGYKRPVARPASFQGRGKKARASQPLVKQLAQRLLHVNNPSLSPFTSSVSLPHEPPLVHPSVTQVWHTSAPFSTLPILSSPPMPLPLVSNAHLHQPPLEDSSSHVTIQVTPAQQFVLPQLSRQQEPNSLSLLFRGESQQQQQKSCPGVGPLLPQNLKLGGIFPLREPNGL